MTADATIDYDSLQQEALRGVVREVLVRVAKTGLPGEHHLYISFDVRAPGVVVSKRLREKYPHEMTIVLQHRFWDLAIQEERFEVKLTFDGIPERLVVPFNAIKVFLDPSVRYVLHFEEQSTAEAGNGLDDETRTGPRPAGSRKPRAPRPKTKSEREAANGLELTTVASSQPSVLSKPAAVPASQANPLLPNAVSAQALSSPPDPSKSEQPANAPAGAQVVSLDAFRKK